MLRETGLAHDQASHIQVIITNTCTILNDGYVMIAG